MKNIEITPGMLVETVLQQLDGEEVVLVRDGHAVGLLSDFDDEELYWYGREHDPDFIASIAEGRERAARGQTISHEELKKQLGID